MVYLTKFRGRAFLISDWVQCYVCGVVSFATVGFVSAVTACQGQWHNHIRKRMCFKNKCTLRWSTPFQTRYWLRTFRITFNLRFPFVYHRWWRYLISFTELAVSRKTFVLSLYCFTFLIHFSRPWDAVRVVSQFSLWFYNCCVTKHVLTRSLPFSFV
jgi:hypothetical protein